MIGAAAENVDPLGLTKQSVEEIFATNNQNILNIKKAILRHFIKGFMYILFVGIFLEAENIFIYFFHP